MFQQKKMSNVRVAVVTGSNKGIGYWIVKGLCKSFDGIVYLTGKRLENFFLLQDLVDLTALMHCFFSKK